MQFEVRLFSFGQFEVINDVTTHNKVPRNEYLLSITMTKKNSHRSLHRIRHTWILRQFHALSALTF